MLLSFACGNFFYIPDFCMCMRAELGWVGKEFYFGLRTLQAKKERNRTRSSLSRSRCRRVEVRLFGEH